MSSNLKVNNILPSTGNTVALSGIASVTSSVSIGGTIVADERLLIGIDTVHPIGDNPQFLLAGNDYRTALLGVQRFQNDQFGATIILAHSRNASDAGHTILQNGDELGKIRFNGSDGVDFAGQGAEISANVDGTPSANNMPTSLRFKTTTSGVAPSEKLRITKEGAIGIGGANYGNNGQVLTSQGAGQPVIWKTLVQAPEISSISGNIFAGSSGQTLTLTGLHFGTGQGTINFTQSSDSVDVNVNVTPSSDTALTVTVPASVGNNVTAGNAVTIKFTNASGLIGSGTNTTVLALPSGGTITTSGNYRIHTFTSSGNFVLTKAVACEYLVVAGGGGGGGNDGGHDFSGGSGGGGAGGYRVGTVTPSANTHTVTVGGGGSGNSSAASGSDGSASAFGSVSSVGGGGGGGVNTNGSNGRGGGSGGGAGGDDGSTVYTGGAGTSGQGNTGGQTGTGSHAGGGGGGGANATGGNGVGHQGGNGGDGHVSAINGTSSHRAGGGGGGNGASASASSGGAGGGGAGAVRSSSNAVAGGTNTGGGGGGGADSNTVSERAGANGGSGLVIVRYDVTNL